MNNAVIQKLFQVTPLVLSFKQASEVSLNLFFKQNANIGKNDRQFISTVIYRLLRNREKILAFLKLSHQKNNPLNEVFCALALEDKKLLHFLSPVEQQWLEQWLDYCQQDNLPLNQQAELPAWIIEALKPDYTEEEIIRLGQALQQQAPIDIRTNILKINRNKLLAELQANGIKAELSQYSPWGIRLQDKPNLTCNQLFLKSYFEIQDEGSQLIAYLVQAKKNQLVVDFCAGSGGKSLAIGAVMANKGSIYALDVDKNRLNQLKLRLNNSAIKNIYPLPISSEADDKLQKFTQKCDRVLVDAPCSGLGTIRRQPDLKYRHSIETLTKINAVQLSIIKHAAKLVKPGGLLIYATCSLLANENQNIVNSFLSEQHDFELVNCQKLLSKIKINNLQEMIFLNPLIYNTDGFFIAVLKKAAK